MKKSQKLNITHKLIHRVKSDNEDRNDLVLLKIAERLEWGQHKYGKSIPIDDGRNWISEGLEEVLDAMVYIANKLLILEEELKNAKRSSNNNKIKR